MAHWDSKRVVDAIAEIEDEKFVLPVIQHSWNIRSCGNFSTHFFCLNRNSQNYRDFQNFSNFHLTITIGGSHEQS